MLKLKVVIGLAVATGAFAAFRTVKARREKYPRPASIIATPIFPEPQTDAPVETFRAVKPNARLKPGSPPLALLLSGLVGFNLARKMLALNTLTDKSTGEQAKTGADNQGAITGLEENRLKLTLGLIMAVWLSGLLGHFTRAREWPALFLYVLGTFGLTWYLGGTGQARQEINLSKTNLKQALTWGGVIGGGLFLSDVLNTYMYYKRGGKPMAEMEKILVEEKFLYLFPVLVLAEEFLWRGLLFKALQDRGMKKHAVVALTTFLYTINHYAVAPVGFKERSMMAGMAVPIGFANGYLTYKTHNLWGGVMIHMLTMVSMVSDLFVIPKLARPRQATLTAA
ncbi:MAG TPA: type II CAAX endopeptidase family protein [Chloroflexia bacterium]|nr:type II CAAX endopeptidase family protein [Chloroflexia bacterium]